MLSDDLVEVAEIVVLLCAWPAMTVWIDHRNLVHIDSQLSVASAPADWIVGTYGPYSAATDIADDLDRMRAEHCPDVPLLAGPSEALLTARAAARLFLRRPLTEKSL
jgi:hypothetical protein